MPAPKYRSRTLRRVFVKTPSGRTVIHYKERKPSRARCAGCGAVLSGVPRERPPKLRKIPLTQKRPQRAFGGYYCSRCARKEIIKRARENV